MCMLDFINLVYILISYFFMIVTADAHLKKAHASQSKEWKTLKHRINVFAPSSKQRTKLNSKR